MYIQCQYKKLGAMAKMATLSPGVYLTLSFLSNVYAMSRVLWLKMATLSPRIYLTIIFYPKYMRCHNAMNRVLWLNSYNITTYVSVKDFFFITSIVIRGNTGNI